MRIEDINGVALEKIVLQVNEIYKKYAASSPELAKELNKLLQLINNEQKKLYELKQVAYTLANKL